VGLYEDIIPYHIENGLIYGIVTEKSFKHRSDMKKKTLLTIGIWAFVIVSIAGTGLGVYTYLSMPARIAEYVSQHKNELKGDKGEQGMRGPMGLAGADGANGANGFDGAPASNRINCTTYGITNQFTSCY
jgi:hypothetical protein